MQRIMLDTNEYDKLLAAPHVYDRLLALLAEGKIELLATHIQKDEIMAVEDTIKKARLQALLSRARMIATRGSVFGVSRFDQSRFGRDEDHKLIEHKLIEHIRRSRWDRDTEDALIAATAATDADVLVTDDESLMRRLNSYPSIQCEVIIFKELERRLDAP
jgi:predicted nucleic acid-binding protein